MKTLYAFCLVSLSAIFTLSCEHRAKTKYDLVKQNGKVYLIRRMFSTGSDLLNEELLNMDSVRDGFSRDYTKGKIRSIGHFSNNVKDSLWTYFDDSGRVVRRENWFLGKKFGEEFQYDRDRRSRKSYLSKYAFNNLEGKKVFELTFEPGSRVKTNRGVPLYTAYNRDVIKVNNEFELMYFFGVPPCFVYEMEVAEWDVNKKKGLSRVEVSDDLPDLQNLTFGKKYLTMKNYATKGIYDWKLRFQLKDSLGNILLRDTSTLRIKVE